MRASEPAIRTTFLLLPLLLGLSACGGGTSDTSLGVPATSTTTTSATSTFMTQPTTTTVITTTMTTTTVTTTTVPPAPPAPPAVDPRFSTCQQALAKGYGPYYKGKDVEYGWYRDADSDGVVCEPAPITTKPKAVPQPGTDPRFGTCKEAKAKGYGPYYRGKDVEYGWYRDADSDGIVCE
ncbi:excalibur calcium-binding domain-containing protein [Allokutzneria oryzae]|uniref:Excalibur calcium-binding domain-containing protein n=1 Tax=Allokutzneria oryzae TaxID=1378989 RepID=A0ABV6A446_9PSEU